MANRIETLLAQFHWFPLIRTQRQGMTCSLHSKWNYVFEKLDQSVVGYWIPTGVQKWCVRWLRWRRWSWFGFCNEFAISTNSHVWLYFYKNLTGWPRVPVMCIVYFTSIRYAHSSHNTAATATEAEVNSSTCNLFKENSYTLAKLKPYKIKHIM